MASPNFPDPDDIPDMSLPERRPPPQRPEPPKPERQNPEHQKPQQRPNAGADSRAGYGWHEGDRVLAPWEPQFLYAGRIARIDGARALIEFDDGDAGWVRLERVQELTVQRGQEVLSRKHMGPVFFAGTIRSVRDDGVLVEFADGDEEWVTVAALRIPCAETGPGAEPTHVGSHLAFLEHLERGDRIWAPWQNRALFAARVDRIDGPRIYVRYDDGDRGWVPREQVFPLLIPVGLRVMSRRKMGRQFLPGTVTAVEGDRVSVQYDDGGREWTRPAALAIPSEPAGRPAPTPSQTGSIPAASQGRILWGWIIPLAISIVILILWFSRR